MASWCATAAAWATPSAEQSGAVETALLIAFQALKERAAFTRKLARKMEERGNRISRERFLEQAAEAMRAPR